MTAPRHPAETQADARMDQLRKFVEWERATHPGKTHIAEWALYELRRLRVAPPAEAQAQGVRPVRPDFMAIKLLVAAGYVTEAKANEALNIAHGFDKGPLAQAQGGGEVAATVVTKLGRDGEVGEPVVMLEPAYEAWLDTQPPSTSHKLYTAPPSAPVGVIGDAIRHLSKWLDANDCECESGHQCGRTEVERTRDQLRALAQRPAPSAPVGVASEAVDFLRDLLRFVHIEANKSETANERRFFDSQAKDIERVIAALAQPQGDKA